MIDLSLTTEQQELTDAFRSLFAREATPEHVRASEPLGFSSDLWKRVVDIGLLEFVTSDGGLDEPLLQGVLVSEAAGEHLAPVPVVEPLVAVRLLEALGTPEAARERDAVLADGRPATVALSPAVGASQEAGGTLRWVPAGAVAGTVLALMGDDVVALQDGIPAEAARNLGSLPVAHRSTAGATVLATGPGAVAAFDRARDDWRVLSAAWLIGAGQRSLDIAVDYTTQRKAWGALIASYQSVAHRIADLATALSGGRLLARKAAWSVDHAAARRDELPAMAYVFAAEWAEATATDALHFHGGYGFMLEYDIQLYLRRIKAWTLLSGDRGRDLAHLADVTWGPVAGGPVGEGSHRGL